MSFIFPMNWIAGLALSAAGGTTTFGVAAGQATDGANAVIMNLGLPLTKTTSAWSAGNGGALDTGSISINTWYHVYLIERLDTLAADVAVSLSASAPTFGANIPSAYSCSRRIGSIQTDGSGNWWGFNQVGDCFYWTAFKQDRNSPLINKTETSIALSVPPGVRTLPLFRCSLLDSCDVTGLRWRTPDLGPSDTVPNSTMEHSQLGFYTDAASTLRIAGAQDMQLTDTSSQLSFYVNAGSASISTFIIDTYGWIDVRGRL